MCKVATGPLCRPYGPGGYIHDSNKNMSSFGTRYKLLRNLKSNKKKLLVKTFHISWYI